MHQRTTPPPGADDQTPTGLAGAAALPVERALLSALLADPTRTQTLDLTPDDLYHPLHTHIYAALATAPPDPVLAAQHVLNALDPRDKPRLADIIAEGHGEPLHTHHYAQQVRDHSRLRRVAEVGRKLTQLAENTSDLDQVDDRLAQAHDTIEQAATDWEGARRAQAVDVPTIRDLLTLQETDHDWLVPGLLERGDRLILTASEGAGKSTLLRQIAVTAAAGIHPFTLADTQPLKVLVLDLENPQPILTRALGRLYNHVHDRIDPTNLRVLSRTAGIDLCTREDRTWLTAVLDHTKPDILVTGPAYKMTAGDTDKETDMKPVALYLDRIRQDTGCAVLLEAHVGNETGQSHRRPERPFGWSGWRRWPELGLYLDKDTGELRHWRGDRDERDWPHWLTRGQEWPFEPVLNETETRWMQIRKTRQECDEYLTIRDICAATGLSKIMVERVVGPNRAHHVDWLRLNGENPYATTKETQ